MLSHGKGGRKGRVSWEGQSMVSGREGCGLMGVERFGVVHGGRYGSGVVSGNNLCGIVGGMWSQIL